MDISVTNNLERDRPQLLMVKGTLIDTAVSYKVEIAVKIHDRSTISLH